MVKGIVVQGLGMGNMNVRMFEAVKYEQRARTVAHGGHQRPGVPGACDRTLHLEILRNVHHRAQPAGNEDRVVAKHVDLGQFAAVRGPISAALVAMNRARRHAYIN